MTTTDRRSTALLLVAGAVLANVAFAGLGTVFDYPDILQEPAAEVLARFVADEGAVVALFAVLALGSGLLAPVAVRLGQLVGGSRGRRSRRVGIAAAVVQVLGLLRWPFVVPLLAARATDPAAPDAARAGAVDTFEILHTVLGTVVGETLGYLLTALWTILIVAAVGRAFAGRWFAGLGVGSAVLIAIGVAAPLGLPGADLANFVGYILWTVWLVALAALLWRRPLPGPQPPTDAARTPSTTAVAPAARTSNPRTTAKTPAAAATAPRRRRRGSPAAPGRGGEHHHNNPLVGLGGCDRPANATVEWPRNPKVARSSARPD